MTSWAHAIGRKAGSGSLAVGDGEARGTDVSADDRTGELAAGISSNAPGAHGAPVPVNLPPIDTRGKTRAQIKAEEYERNCGALWRNYQSCLKVRHPLSPVRRTTFV